MSPSHLCLFLNSLPTGPRRDNGAAGWKKYSPNSDFQTAGIVPGNQRRCSIFRLKDTSFFLFLAMATMFPGAGKNLLAEPPAFSLIEVIPEADGMMHWTLNDPLGQVWRLERSRDLLRWDSLGLQSAAHGKLSFRESEDGQAFYRGVLELSPAPQAAFSSPCFTISESDSTVTLTVTRRGDARSPMRVDFLSLDVDSAVAESDYRKVAGAITFAPGEMERSLTISILPDELPEEDEGFLVSLVPEGGGEVDALDIALVVILDDDQGVETLTFCGDFIPAWYSFSPRPLDLVSSEGDLFWSEAGEAPLQRWSASTGSSMALAQKMGRLDAMVVRDGFIYRLESRDGAGESGCAGFGTNRALVRTHLDGSEPLVLATFDTCEAGVGDLIVDPHYAFVVSSTTSPPHYEILRVPVTGGDSVAIMETGQMFRRMASDGAFVYWSQEDWEEDTGSRTNLYRVSRHGGEVEKLGGSFGQPAGNFVVDQGCAYVADLGFSALTLYSLDVATGEKRMLWEGPRVPKDWSRQLSTRDGFLYWMDDISINRVALTGGEREVLATDLRATGGFLIEDNVLYWSETERNGGVFSRVLNGAGGPGQRVADAEFPEAQAVFDGHLYWVESGPFSQDSGFGRIASMPLTGGAASTAVGGISEDMPPFVVAGEFLCLADRWTIRRVHRDGGNAEVLAVGSFSIASLASDGEFVYWIETDPQTPVRRVPVAGGPMSFLGSGGGGFPNALRVHGDKLYWIDRESKVASMPKTGGEMKIELEGHGIISDLLIHGSHLYLSFAGSGALGRIPLAGGPMENFAPGELQSAWTRLATDGSQIYRLGQAGLDQVNVVTGKSDILLNEDMGQDLFFSGAIAAANGRIWWTETVSGKLRTLQ